MPRTTRLALAAGLALGLTAAAPATPEAPAAEAVSATKSPTGQSATAVIRDAGGRALGTVRIERYDAKKSRVSVSVRGLTPGFHGFHVHAKGVCDPDAVERDTETPFASAGSHLGPGTHGRGAGDMPPLLVAADGTASASFVTDRFTLERLADANGSAFIVHAEPDNFAHIPRRYFHRPDATGAVGPDATTLKTGDSGPRVGCGVVRQHA